MSGRWLIIQTKPNPKPHLKSQDNECCRPIDLKFSMRIPITTQISNNIGYPNAVDAKYKTKIQSIM